MSRKVTVAVISNLHLGSSDCRANELLIYLKSIDPKLLILNGDIIDRWQCNKCYFPQFHLDIICEILWKASNGTRVVYIAGNHDEFISRYSGMELGNICLADRFTLSMDNKKMWFSHGDVLEKTPPRKAKFIANLGGTSNNWLTVTQFFFTIGLRALARQKIFLSKKVKKSVNKAVEHISNFEKTLGDFAISKGFDYVLCGQLHQPGIKVIQNNFGEVTYLNSGDWVEHLSALEYQNGAWQLYFFNQTTEMK